MSEAKHTPGPWKVRTCPSGYPYQIEAPNGDDRKAGAVGKRVTRWGCFMLPSSDEAMANARLIAAAPEMLEAAKKLIATLHGFGLQWNCVPVQTDVARLEEVLSRATGKESA